MTDLEVGLAILVALIIVAWWDVRRMLRAVVAELSTQRWQSSVEALRARRTVRSASRE